MKLSFIESIQKCKLIKVSMTVLFITLILGCSIGFAYDKYDQANSKNKCCFNT